MWDMHEDALHHARKSWASNASTAFTETGIAARTWNCHLYSKNETIPYTLQKWDHPSSHWPSCCHCLLSCWAPWQSLPRHGMSLQTDQPRFNPSLAAKKSSVKSTMFETYVTTGPNESRVQNGSDDVTKWDKRIQTRPVRRTRKSLPYPALCHGSPWGFPPIAMNITEWTPSKKTKTNMTDAQSLKQLLSGFVQVFEEHACFLHADRLVCVICVCQTSRNADTGNQVTKWLEVPQILIRLAQNMLCFMMFHAFGEDFNATAMMLWFPNFHSCFKSGPPLLFSRVDGGAAERIAMHSSGMRHRSVQYQYVICHDDC